MPSDVTGTVGNGLAILPLATGALLLVIGFLWSPIGGAMVSRLSGRPTAARSIEFDQAARASMMLLLPWVYLLLEALGRTPGRRVVTAGYVAILLLWLFGPFAFWLHLTIGVVFNTDQEAGLLGLPGSIVWAPVSGIIAYVYGAKMYRAARQLMRHDRSVRGGSVSSVSDRLAPEYLGVFKTAAFSYVWLLPLFVLFYAYVFLTYQW